MRLLLVQPQLGYGPDARNVEQIAELVLASALPRDPGDVLLLPEHVSMETTRDGYVDEMSDVARRIGCHVVGGSQHELRDDGTVNSGLVLAPDGAVLGGYEKIRPYAAERARVRPGAHVGQLEIAGRRVLILLCADFWFADLLARATALPDLVLVPALSVTRKPTPDYSRALWRHLAVARAYEYGCFVGVSDWAHPSKLPALITSGVGGFADPTRIDPEALWTALGEQTLASFTLDFDALEAFRRDRRERGFFWWP